MNILVVGSINMDIVMNVKDIVKPGETISSSDYQTFYGGKGANQAVGCAQLGADVSFIGCIGDDNYGNSILRHFKKKKMDTSGISIKNQTGMAMIQVNDVGENAIVLVPGANYQITIDDINQHKRLLEKADTVLLQLEIPLDVVKHAIQLAKSYHCRVILNPAPVCDLPDQLLKQVDILTPNEIELTSLSGVRVNSVQEAKQACRLLLEKGVHSVVSTLGENGSVWVSNTDEHHQPALNVPIIDTTGAGDAYNAGLTVGLSRGMSIKEAMKLATYVSGYVVSKRGAQPQIPSIEKIISQISSLS